MTAVPVVPWESLPLVWRQGEHVSIIATTGGGKTTLIGALARLRRNVAVIATKPVDTNLRRLFAEPEWRTIRSWPPPDDARRVILWPPSRSLRREARDEQAAAIGHALDGMYRSGAWTIACDELHTLADSLGLRHELTELWRTGRSNGISVLGATQRPSGVPLEAYSQASHLFLGPLADRRDVDRIAETVDHLDRDMVRRVVANLPRFRWLYVARDPAYVCITDAPRYPVR